MRSWVQPQETTPPMSSRGHQRCSASSWAASLLALLILSTPSLSRAQDDAFTTAAADALNGFADVLRSKCFPALSGPVRIAVAELGANTKISREDALMLPGRIETVLEGDRLIRIVPRRELGLLLDLIGDLAGGGPGTGARIRDAGRQVDAVVRIRTEDAAADGRPKLRVVAYTVDGQCQATARGAIAISGITRPFDVPDAFFADAARALLDQRIERVVVMPVVTGAGIASDDIGQQMQRELASAIRRTLETERRWRPGDDRSVQVAPYGEGMPVQGAWQARLLLDRSRRGSRPGSNSAALAMRPSSAPGGSPRMCCRRARVRRSCACRRRSYVSGLATCSMCASRCCGLRDCSASSWRPTVEHRCSIRRGRPSNCVETCLRHPTRKCGFRRSSSARCRRSGSRQGFTSSFTASRRQGRRRRS